MNTTPFIRLVNKYAPRWSTLIDPRLQPDGQTECFKLSTPQPGRLQITGNTPIALAVGFNWFLKYFCNAHISWCGCQLDLPDTPPALEREFSMTLPLAVRPYLNYCTFGYTAAFWNWERWEDEIDFMALNGLNMPLAVTGIEAVWYRTFLRAGLTDAEVRAFLSGPAFLPWQWMNNMHSHCGPLPLHWIETHRELGRRIIEAERAWGMKPILPLFSGQIPPRWEELHPEATVHPGMGWCNFPGVNLLEPTDPAYAELTGIFIAELIEAFGTDHYYSLDLFHEQAAPDESETYLSHCGKFVYEQMRRADPEAVWVMQAWRERGPIIQAVPAERLLLLDMGKERLEATGGMFGAPVAWGIIHSFGGQTEIGGNLAYIPETFHRLRQKYGNLVGGGAFPESIVYNPVIFELMFETTLRQEKIELLPWLQAYVKRRYGALPEPAWQAWQIMLQTVYCNRRTDGVFSARPRLDVKAANAWIGFNLDTDQPGQFFPPWELLLQAADELGGNAGYRFDVLTLGRQALVALGKFIWHDAAEAFKANDQANFEARSEEFLTLMRDCDALLATHPLFRMDKFLQEAAACAEEPAEKALYEYNVRMQLTLWGPVDEPQPLFDYCCREWHGLLKDYYLVRWEMFIDFLRGKLARNEKYDETDLVLDNNRPALKANAFYEKLYQFEAAWTRGEQPTSFEADVESELLLRSRQALRKYLPLYRRYQPLEKVRKLEPGSALLDGLTGQTIFS